MTEKKEHALCRSNTDRALSTLILNAEYNTLVYSGWYNFWYLASRAALSSKNFASNSSCWLCKLMKNLNTPNFRIRTNQENEKARESITQKFYFSIYEITIISKMQSMELESNRWNSLTVLSTQDCYLKEQQDLHIENHWHTYGAFGLTFWW